MRVDAFILSHKKPTKSMECFPKMTNLVSFSNSPFINATVHCTLPFKCVISTIQNFLCQSYGTPEGTFLFQYLQEKKLKQKELQKKSKQ